MGEDNRHNARHIHLNGQVGILAAVDLPANHTLGILDGNPPLRVIDKDDEQNQCHDPHQEDGGAPPLHGAVGQVGHQRNQVIRQPGNDIGKQDNGDTVADAELGNLFAQSTSPRRSRR